MTIILIILAIAVIGNLYLTYQVLKKEAPQISQNDYSKDFEKLLSIGENTEKGYNLSVERLTTQMGEITVNGKNIAEMIEKRRCAFEKTDCKGCDLKPIQDQIQTIKESIPTKEMIANIFESVTLQVETKGLK